MSAPTPTPYERFLPWRRRFEVGFWVVFLAGNTVANSLVEIIALRRDAVPGHALWEPVVWEASSSLLWAELIPAIIAFSRRFPFHWDSWRRVLPWHVAASMLVSLVHVLGPGDRHFLSRTIRMLADDASHDTAMIYVSDHGESLGEGNLYLHGFPYAIAPQTQIKVPMVAWLSPGMHKSVGIDPNCLARQADLPISHDNLFHSVLGLMQIDVSVYDIGLDVFAGCASPSALVRQ